MKTFGSDPELLLTKNGKPYSAIGVVQGDPENRITVRGHQFYYDNVLAECAVKPGKTKKEVLDNFRECLQIYADMVRPLRLTVQACVDFPEEQLQTEEAKKAGCAADWCAYEVKLKEAPKELMRNGTLRSCGGHVHIGSEILASDGPEPILGIHMLDLFVGVPSLHLDRDPSSSRRRVLYGQAGRYRTKDYGIEYRSLSNFWLISPQMTGLIYDLSMFAADFVEDGRAWEMWDFDIDVFFESETLSDAWKCKGYNAQAMKKGIDSGDKQLVAEHFELAKRHLPTGLLKDLQKMISRPEDKDLYKNWKLQ